MEQRLKPLAGYKVVDFGHYVAGPAAGAMLADFGANVISVVPPGGPRWRHPTSDVLSRGKTRIELDLKDAADLEKAKQLVTHADVVIENFRPGVMAKLGLSYENFASNPGLVYLSLPGFASTDRERAHLRAFEGIISAASGQFTDMGLNRVLMGINPSFSPLTLASAYGAVIGTNAVIYCLLARTRSRRGDRIEVPLATALMEGLVYNSQRVERYPERYKSPREKEIERRQAQGVELNMKYDELQEFLDPFYRSYVCADGRMIYVVCASHTAHSKRALEVLGLWDEIKALGIPEQDDWYRPISEWKEDCALGHYPLSAKWAAIVSEKMAKAFATDTAFAWEQKLGDGRVPARAHRTTQEWLNSDHAAKAGLVQEMRHPELGAIKSFGPMAWLRQTDIEYGLSPWKTATAENVLQTWRAAPRDSATPEADTASWLEGYKILDMTNVIAGPTISSFLSRFGPEIIKLDPVKSTFDPWNTIVFGMQAGRGKQSILADVTSEEGRSVLHRLIKWADLITFNGTDRQVDGLGLDEETLRQINPKVVLCQIDAFGGPERGPMSNHPGYDDTVQAMTGIMIRFGGGTRTPEEHAHFGTIDVLGGFLASAAAGAALLMRTVQGKVARARSSLAAAGQLIQAPFMYDHEGRAAFDEASGRSALGQWAGYRFYQTSDGWIFLACANESELGRLFGKIGIAAALSDIENQQILEGAIKTRPSDEWLRIASDLDLGMVTPSSLAVLRDQYLESAPSAHPLDRGTYVFERHEIAGADRNVDLFSACAVRPERGEITSFPPAEKYGASTRRILSNLQFSEAEVERLLARGTVSEQWCEYYLPE